MIALIPTAFSVLGCAGVAWYWGRELSSADPAILGEALQRHRTRLLLLGLLAAGLQAAVALAAPAAARSELAPLAFAAPLTVVAILAANFPLRRRLLGESWSFPAYVGFGVRLALGLYGYSLLVSLSPLAVIAAGSWRWPVALTLWGLTAFVTLCADRFIPFVLGAATLSDEALREPFARVLSRSHLREVEVRHFVPRGGTWGNAIAVPGRHRSLVLFSTSLLASLDAAETTAIFAHEIGHLEEREHWTRLRRWRIALAAVPTCGAAALGAIFGAGSELLAVMTMPLVLLLHARVAGNSRDHETASDLRAVELCGDTEVVVRALIKVHAIGFRVRRMAVDLERRSTHPSLARRLQAVRAFAADRGVAPPSDPLVDLHVEGVADTADCVHFGADGLRWVKRGGESSPQGDTEEGRLLPYAELTELRVNAGRRGAELHARLGGGEHLILPLKAEDVAGVQGALDCVDGYLAPLPSGSAVRGAAITLALFLAALPLMLTAWARPVDLIVLLFVTVAAMQRQRSVWVSVTAAMGLAAAATLIVGGGTAVFTSGLATVGLLCVLGGSAWALWMSMRGGDRDGDETAQPAPTRVAMIALLVLSLPWLFAVAFAASSVHPLLSLAVVGRHAQGAILPLVGAAVLLATRGRWRRLAAAPLLLLGLAPLLLGAPGFLVDVAGEPLVAGTPPIVYRQGAALFTAETTLDGDVDTWDFAVAPDGNHFAVRLGDPDGEREAETNGRYLVASFAGRRDEIAAMALTFADARHLLAVVADEEDVVEVRLLALDDLRGSSWSTTLPGADPDAWFQVQATASAWRVVAWGSGSMTDFRGVVGAAGVENGRLEYDPDGYVDYYAVDASGAFAADASATPFRYAPRLGRVAMLLGMPRLPRVTRLGWWRDGVFQPALTTSLSVDWCETAPFGGESLCVFDDGENSWAWMVDFTARTFRPFATFPDEMDWTWTGERLITLQRDEILVVDAPGSGRRLRLDADVEWGSEVVANGDVLLLAEPTSDGRGLWLRRVNLAAPVGAPG